MQRLLAFLLCLPAFGTITLVQKQAANSTSGVTSQAVTMGSTPTVGDIIVVGWVDNANGGAVYFTDNQSTRNAYQIAPRFYTGGISGSFIGSGIACATVTVASGTFTITLHSSNTSFISMFAVEYSGGSCIPDQIPVGVTGTTSPFSCGGSFTTANANDLLVAVIDYNLASGTAAFGAGSGFTIQLSQTSSTDQPGAYEDQIVSSTGTFNPEFTAGANATSTCVSAAFEAAAAPPSGGQKGFPIVQ